ncbi:J domain-containing protein [Hydromonas duriensis]|uniref:DnaJ-like protein n=1 Tax=Hydromonas duriensis TaxID=1527608 RepID=A0A4R6Y5C6_9BURK|nr:J domain-containing protein [Hydromonas duriensis]TDR30246.1 DnaJ-like protein [Hydromonas duriensis]
MSTYYETLGVSQTAPQEVIKAAYKVLAQKYHPDRNANGPNTTKKMQLINEAYRILSNPAERAKYDDELLNQRQQKQRDEKAKAAGNERQNAYASQQRQRQTQESNQEQSNRWPNEPQPQTPNAENKSKFWEWIAKPFLIILISGTVAKGCVHAIMTTPTHHYVPPPTVSQPQQVQAPIVSNPIQTSIVEQQSAQPINAPFVEQYQQAKVRNDTSRDTINQVWNNLPASVKSGGLSNQKQWIQSKQTKCGVVDQKRQTYISFNFFASDVNLPTEIQLLDCDTAENNARTEVLKQEAQVATSAPALSKECAQIVKNDMYYRAVSLECKFPKRRADNYFSSQYNAQGCPALSDADVAQVAESIRSNINSKLSNLSRPNFCAGEYDYWNKLDSSVNAQQILG